MQRSSIGSCLTPMHNSFMGCLTHLFRCPNIINSHVEYILTRSAFLSYIIQLQNLSFPIYHKHIVFCTWEIKSNAGIGYLTHNHDAHLTPRPGRCHDNQPKTASLFEQCKVLNQAVCTLITSFTFSQLCGDPEILCLVVATECCGICWRFICNEECYGNCKNKSEF